MYKIIDEDLKMRKYRARNFYTRYIKICDKYGCTRTIAILTSYSTIIGYHDIKRARVYTWGYGSYSTTTSKQITQYCHETCSTRYDINHVSLDDFINNIME